MKKEKTKMQLILESLGFQNVTGALYTHEFLGIIHFPDDLSGNGIAIRIFEAGERRKLQEVKSILEIK